MCWELNRENSCWAHLCHAKDLGLILTAMVSTELRAARAARRTPETFSVIWTRTAGSKVVRELEG